MTNSEQNVRPPLATYEDLARRIDVAAVAPDLSEEDVSRICGVAKRYRTGRVTVRPADLDLVTGWMNHTGITVGTVVAYPHSADTTAARLYATRDALQRGAKSIETVINLGKLLSRQFRYIESELMQMTQECRRAGAALIVDFEMPRLSEDLRVIACKIARRAEVDWVRGASLYSPSPSTDADLAFLTAKLGDWVKVDAGGSVTSVTEALTAYNAGVEGFQTTDPAPLLDEWTAELKRRAENEGEVRV